MKIALIGYGNIAQKHLEVFRALGCEIVASCNRSEAANQRAKLEAGIPLTFDHPIKMVETVRPDAILNCVSFGQLFQTTVDLIPFGIPILMEKPPGTSVEELEQLIKIQAEHGTPVQVALNRRHYTVIHNAIQDAGGRENIRSVSIEWSEAPLKLRDKNGFTQAQVAQYIYANSLHGLDMLTYFGGTPQQPQILTQDDGGFLRWRMHLAGQAEDGKILSFSSSWDNPVPWRMVLEAPNFRYVFAPLETCKKMDSSYKLMDMEPDACDLEFKAGFYHQAQHFLKVASQKLTDHPHDLRSALAGMELAEQLATAFSS